MTANPILKVLSTFKKYKVKSLLIGGQACIIYGAAEFSRDSDFVIISTSENIESLNKALTHLKATLIYFPPLDATYLEKGHACHFQCGAKTVRGLRIDIISKLRGCDPFDELWKRRKTITLKNKIKIDVIGLNDLVQSKKTQRDKDWFMLKRLVENDTMLNNINPPDECIRWWFRESRVPETLIKLSDRYPRLAKEGSIKRPLLAYAISKDLQMLNSELYKEEQSERQKDIEYWAPLKKELEDMRHKKL